MKSIYGLIRTRKENLKKREVLVIYYMENGLEVKKVVQTEMAATAADAISEVIEKCSR